jgi:uncharacterized membrane protein YhaH (DUF805 family)
MIMRLDPVVSLSVLLFLFWAALIAFFYLSFTYLVPLGNPGSKVAFTTIHALKIITFLAALALLFYGWYTLIKRLRDSYISARINQGLE